jgi:hypothetical protein
VDPGSDQVLIDLRMDREALKFLCENGFLPADSDATFGPSHVDRIHDLPDVAREAVMTLLGRADARRYVELSAELGLDQVSKGARPRVAV